MDERRENITKIFKNDVREKSKLRQKQVVSKKRPKRILTPYDLNRRDPAYKPGPVTVTQLPKCRYCGKYFIKSGPRQKFCCPQHRWLYHKS